MSNEKKNRTIAAIGTLLVHALVLLVLFLMAFRTPLPLPGEEGVEVDLGLYNQGMGLVQPDQPAIPEPAAPTPPPAEDLEKSKEEIVTQDIDEAPALPKIKEEKPKKQPEVKPKEQPKEPEPPKEEPKPTVDQRALFKGPNKSQDGGSEGITGQPGDQGNPNGMKDVKKYDGQGGQGNGPGYSLGGRGAKSLQRPSADFPEEGHVVVAIWVDREGNVVRAEIAKGTDITNKEMHNMALEAARRSKFSPDPTAPEEQKGTITYTFVQNR
ncbi:MAG: energy transducer TonB [Bacteroidales bacterium]|nr:energy transducer TonB [Bacteroidales bacterium]